MGIRSRIRGPVGASADARYLHRALITDDTHSPSRMWRADHRRYTFAVANVARCNRASPGPPKRWVRPHRPGLPAAAAAGEVNSSTTHRVHLHGGGLRLRGRSSRSGLGKQQHRVASPTDFTRRIRGASTCAPSRVPVSAGIERRAGSRLGPTGLGQFPGRWGRTETNADQNTNKAHAVGRSNESSPPGRREQGERPGRGEDAVMPKGRSPPGLPGCHPIAATGPDKTKNRNRLATIPASLRRVAGRRVPTKRNQNGQHLFIKGISQNLSSRAAVPRPAHPVTLRVRTHRTLPALGV